MTQQKYSEIISKHNLCMLAIGCIKTGKCEVIYPRGEPVESGLLPHLFGDAQTISSLNESLDGQLMPTIWSQGNMSCIVCKPDEERIIGAFTTEERSVVDKYKWSKELNQDILSLG